MIERFWVVTTTSVYQVETFRKTNRACATKIAGPVDSCIPVGKELRGGSMIAIGHTIQAYTPGGTYPVRRFEDLSDKYRGEHSSSIVALFLDEESARLCHDCGSTTRCDPRWHAETREALEEIGDEHPTFYICRGPLHALFPPVGV